MTDGRTAPDDAAPDGVAAGGAARTPESGDTSPVEVVLVAEAPDKPGGPAAWVSGLAAGLAAAGVETHLVYALDGAGLRRSAGELVPGRSVVHTYSQAPGSLWLAQQARRKGVPVVHTVHGDFFAEQATKRGLKSLLWLRFNRRAVGLADIVTVPSGYLAGKLAVEDPRLADRTAVIPNGIDYRAIAAATPMDRTGELGVEDGAALVAAVTTFTHRPKAEGVIPLCEAVTGLRETGRRVELRIAGEGALRQEIASRCAGEGIRFLGYVPDAARLIASADVFAHSSGLDVFAYVVLEAFATGTPTVVTPVGGIAELVGDAAEQVPPDDPAVLGSTIAHLLDDPEHAARLRERGRAQATGFDWSHLVQDDWLPLYRRAVAGHLA